MQGRLELKANVLDGFIFDCHLSNPSYPMNTIIVSNYVMYPFYRLKKIFKKVYLYFDAWREKKSSF
ncbi:hypothetical protein FHK02_4802 [Spirosoma sp. LMG 31448]|nr:hypothetical protein [Spirosoma utsteinense]